MNQISKSQNNIIFHSLSVYFCSQLFGSSPATFHCCCRGSRGDSERHKRASATQDLLHTFDLRPWPHSSAYCLWCQLHSPSGRPSLFVKTMHTIYPLCIFLFSGDWPIVHGSSSRLPALNHILAKASPLRRGIGSCALCALPHSHISLYQSLGGPLGGAKQQRSCGAVVNAAQVASGSLVFCLSCESVQKTQESHKILVFLLQATFGESMTRMFVGTCALWLPCLPLFWFMRKALNSRTNTK